MLDFSTLKSLTIPEGRVIKVVDVNGSILWEFSNPSISDVVSLQVEKITSDTYINKTAYTGEEFILLAITPKAYGTVNITYGGLTKTITDTTGEETSLEVFFGTYGGVSDEVTTPASGELKIEGDYRSFAVGDYNKTKSAIAYCSCITAINDFGNIEYLEYYMFANCTSLTSINIPNYITSIGSHAFHGCINLISIIIPDSVTSIDNSAFTNCSGLTSITIPNSVTSISSNTFYNCSGLTSITIPNSVIGIGDSAFHGCANLISIIIPDSVTSIGENAFTNCSGLTSIIIPDSVTSIGANAFENTAYYIDSSNWENNVLYINNHLIKAKDTLSGEYIIKNEILTISGSAFLRCVNLISIVIPDNVISIGANAFYGCTGLTSITIPKGVTNIKSGTFLDCTNLTSITIPKNVTSIDNDVFSGCSGLTSIVFEEPDGWWYSRLNNATSGAAVDLSDPSANVTMFTNTHEPYYWRKS